MWRERAGTLGGAAALACTTHEIMMIIYTKSGDCLCPPDLSALEGDGKEGTGAGVEW